jgi:N-acetylneuraminic acid mutarotase
MPTGRWLLSTSVVDGKIYAIGGGRSYSSQSLRTVEEYDPATDTWTRKADMPTARANPSTSAVNGKIYAMGGGELSGGASATRAFSTVEEYDPATDTWTTKSEMPTARFGHSANVVDGRIYVIGGGPSCPWCGAILTLEVYEPATDTWTRKADIPRPIISASTNVVDGKIYAFGGEGTGRRVDEYDPVTDTWTRKADMPSYRTDLSSSVVYGKIYAIGGDGTGEVIVATVEVYDPTMDTWTTAPDMPTARTGLRTSVVNGKIYAIGGLPSWGGAALSTVEEYDPNPLVVDFNGDEIVDIEDLIILIEHWGTDEPLCDIAPPPSGDGIVDVQDLEVLMRYWQQEVLPVNLRSYWKLDETEGSIAYDSAGYHDGILYGEPLWQPAAGAVAGALAFDGTDDYVSTDLVLNPADGPFSVFAWIKEGAPGQVIISQADRTIFGTTISTGSAWLSTDPAEGKLMTELQDPGQTGGPLASQTVVTDGGWHRVGLTWDSSNRILYVDDVEVARDTQPQFGSSRTGLYIGAGNNLEPGSFFSGLIDDVRIYDQAITKVATKPSPADGAQNVPIDTTLSWRPGLGAATHDVYFGTSSPPAFIGTQAANRFDPGLLELNTTYYWQVDEFDGTATYKGDVWSFNTAEPGLVGLWKLDETEGDIAYDSAGDNDGTLYGEPLWQPTGGQIDGALQFDGIDDYVSADLMLPRADAKFSVFAWIKGGIPGQVVFSQAAVSDWLGADTTNGSLMTELRFPFKPSRRALQSQVVITDGNWHRIGLVWDGSNRILYVDDVQVASDTYDKGYLFGGLQIGAGKNLDPGTFWFGLIDDVRIYNRAVTP